MAFTHAVLFKFAAAVRASGVSFDKFTVWLDFNNSRASAMAEVVVAFSTRTRPRFTDERTQNSSGCLPGRQEAVDSSRQGHEGWAHEVCGKVESLVSYALSREAISTKVAKWLGEIDDILHARIVKAGLAKPRHHASMADMTVAAFVAEFIARRVDVKPGTITNYKQAQSKLADTLTEQDGSCGDATRRRSFPLMVEGQQKREERGRLAENSARSIVKNAKLFFVAAIKGNLIATNPFSGHSTTIMKRRDRQQFVSRETISRKQGEFREVPLFPEVRAALEELRVEPDGADFVVSNQRQGQYESANDL